MPKIALSLFIVGLCFGWGPCFASCGPLFISYILGTKKSILPSIMDYIFFSLARISVYVVLSLLIFFLGRWVVDKFLGDFSRYIYMVAGLFIVGVGGLMILGKRWQFNFFYQKGTVVSLGLFMGLLPCAPLLSVFSSLALFAKDWLESLSYSLSFGLGTFFSPLIFLAIFAGAIPQYLVDKKNTYYFLFNISCGLIIVFLGSRLIREAF